MKTPISYFYPSTPLCLRAPAGTALGLRAALVMLGLGCLLTLSAQAATTYWDPQGRSGSNPYTNSLSDTWENPVWSTSRRGQSSPKAWVDNTTALFGVHTGYGTPPFTVTMNGSPTVSVVYVVAGFFPPKGTYTGLFYETNAVAPASSGTFTLTTTANRHFSGSLQLAGVGYPLQGTFDTDGTAQVSLRAHKPSPLQLTLQLDLIPDSDRIAGTVSDGTWTAQLAGDRMVYDGTKHVAPEHGAYTLVIPGGDEQSGEPCGHGYGTVSVTKAGRIHLAATLADGTKVSQAAVVSKYGQWPLYLSLYSRHGLLGGG